MKSRSLVNICALSLFTAVSFASFNVQAADSDSGGSAGDADKPITYTKKSFEELDTNHDGIVDKKEASLGKLDGSFVKKIDTNSDGSVSSSEFDAYLATQPVNNRLPKVTK